MSTRIVLDTNVLVAAGFNPRSSAARIVEALRSDSGKYELVWNEATRSESRYTIERIPPLDWQDFAALFAASGEFTGSTEPEAFTVVADPDDREFAALAAAAGAWLISNDQHVLTVRDQLGITVRTPSELLASD